MKRLKDIWEHLPDLDYTYKYFDEASNLRTYEICGRKFQETAKIDYVLDCLKKVESSYGERTRQAERNENIDFKAISHALRAAYQVKELLTENTITFPLKEAPFLREVKQGKLDYLKEVAPKLEALMEEVEILSENSTLPEKPDRKFWDQFIIDVIDVSCGASTSCGCCGQSGCAVWEEYWTKL